jgi:CRISPR/Cas system CSM-associated protein Csm3 (group 7 of RAMP superfamily)
MEVLIVNELIRIEFNLISKSKLHFGCNEQGLLLKDSHNKPFIMGSSIGGCIRNYLKDIEDITGIDTNYYFGSEGKDKVFDESKLTIFDAVIEDRNNENIVGIKEGTKINPKRGVAEDNNKYDTEYLKKDTNITVIMETEISDEREKNEFINLMKFIRLGFENTRLKLGGQINNGFGIMKVHNIIIRTVDLTNPQELVGYLIDKRYKDIIMTSSPVLSEKYISLEEKLIIKMEGSFPYGVYQHYGIKNKSVTGLQGDKDGYYIPASTIKGILRSQFEKLLNNCLKDGIIEAECLESIGSIFGSTDIKGAGVFQDILINDGEIINDTNKNDRYTTYNKIDRLTGGSFTSALMKQREIRGKAMILFELDRKKALEYVYPLLIIMRDIAIGITPIGGRTSIGLGEFRGTRIHLIDTKGEYNLDVEIEQKEGMEEKKWTFDEKSRNNIEILKKKFINVQGGRQG